MSLWRPHGLQKPNRLLRPPPFSFSIVYLYLPVCLYLPAISILRQPVYQSPSACLSVCSPAFLSHTVLHALDASFISSNNIRSHVRSHNDGSGRKEKKHFVPTPSTYKSYLLNPPLMCLRLGSVCIQGGDMLKQHMLMIFKMFISKKNEY